MTEDHNATSKDANREFELSDEQKSGIISHMNDDHADAVALYFQAHSQLAGAKRVLMVDLTTESMTLHVEWADRTDTAVVPLSRPLRSVGDARSVLVEMAKAARATVAAKSAP